MLDQARTLIRQCQETQSTYLDLGNCGITDLNELPELFECGHLETLILSSDWDEYEHGKLVDKRSKNQGRNNHLSELPKDLLGLKRLKKLICAGLSLSKWEISDIRVIAELSNLHSLDLSYNQITDIRILEKLTSLHSLHLGSNQISDIRPLEELVGLRFLDLSFNRISDIRSLEKLVGLHKVDLGYNKIANVSYLEQLINLRSLDLTGNQIIDIRSLEKLSGLHDLNLGKNPISDRSILAKLSSLRRLTLQSSQITDCSFLEKLASLQYLNLRQNQITDIHCLKKLNELQYLDLGENQLSDIGVLSNLPALLILSLEKNPIFDLSSLEELVNLPYLMELILYGIRENSLNIPPEHFGNSSEDNCLESLKGYFASIKKGATQTHEVPVILVGNSTAGKTSLLEFMRHQTFPPAADHSTHGVVPAVWVPDTSVLGDTVVQTSDNQLQFYFWDFGGQEYYHATHRLFFSRQAIYVLLWEQKTNVPGVQTINIRLKKPDHTIHESEQPVALFPYTYWLKTIRAYAQDANYSPVIMVQNKLDEAGNDQKDYPGGDFRQQYGISEVFHLSIKEACATQPDGQWYQEYKNFLRHLLHQARDQQVRYARQTHWEPVKAMLQERRQENILTHWEFLQALQTIDPNIELREMLSYGLSLHDSGFIFYYPYDEALGNDVFINPEWVVENIYGILDDTVRAQGGKFTRQKVVQQLSDQYADLFIALMKKFELIFENQEASVYIAPQYLPETCADKNVLLAYRAALPPEASLIVLFPEYMPPSLIQRLIAEFGDQAVGKVYWKYGGIFLLENQHVLMESQPDEGRLLFTAKEHNPSVLWTAFARLREKTDHNNQLYLSLDHGTHFLKVADIEQQIRLGNRDAKVETLAGDSCSIAAYGWLFDVQKPKNKAPMSDEKKALKLFISYAHKDKDYFRVFVDEFGEHLNNAQKYRFNAFDDRQLVLGSDWNAQLEQEVADRQVGILLLSAAFLNSEYIQEKELGAMLEKLEEREDFVLVPVYFKAFQFEEFDFLKPYQFFKPDGAKYGQADKGTNLCFSHLVKFSNVNGVNLPIPNASRDDYLLDLSSALFRALDEKFQV